MQTISEKEEARVRLAVHQMLKRVEKLLKLEGLHSDESYRWDEEKVAQEVLKQVSQSV